MGFLKNVVKNAVGNGIGNGISKGISEAVGSAVKKVVDPAAERWADATAKQIDSSAQMINSSAEATAKAADEIAAASGQQTAERKNPFENLTRAAENLARAAEEAEDKAKHAKFVFPVLDGTGKPYVNEVLKLVAENNGFELVVNFDNLELHRYGGKGNAFWYEITNGVKSEAHIAEYVNGAWTAKLGKKIDDNVTLGQSDAGTVLEMIAQRLFFGKNVNLEGASAEDASEQGYGITKYQFDYSGTFYKFSNEFGVTVAFDDTDKPNDCFRFRYFSIGDETEVPDYSVENY